LTQTLGDNFKVGKHFKLNDTPKIVHRSTRKENFMKNKECGAKEYSNALLTIGSIISGTFNSLYYYVSGEIWVCVYIGMNVLILSVLTYLCLRINDRFEKRRAYMILTTVVIPLLVGSFISQILI